MVYDVVIAGGGAAGLSAALYAGRARLKALVIEKYNITGSQIIYTNEVDNYLGIPSVSGFELVSKFKEHAINEAEFTEGEVSGITKADGIFNLKLADGTEIKSKTVIIATGAIHNKLGIKGEEEFTGKGVSYCATCDGAFYKGKNAVVAGGGDTALSEALYLSNICNKVYLLHRRNELRGSKIYQDKIKSTENIEFIGNVIIDEIKGEEKVSSIAYHNKTDNTQAVLPVNGVFIAIGMKPDTDMLKGLADIDGYGYVIAGEDGRTNISGLFVAGDIRQKKLRQLITAVSDGANCIASVEEYLNKGK
ncbi:MAG: FAD-dependent oxidoreductase [Lachnospiraceae bacterium]|nr:FAD-dependent oxidoreductase [Lachnospiraceae bacterium]